MALSDSSINASYSRPDAEREFSERVALLYRNSPVVLLGVPAASIVLGWYFWDTQAHGVLGGWVGFNLALSLVRGWFYRNYCNQTHINSKRWARLYIAFAFVSGVAWGLLPWLILDPSDTYNILVIMLVLFGMVAGSIASHAPVFSSYVAYSCPVAVLLASRLAMEGGDYVVLAVLLLAFLLVNMGYAWNQRKFVIEMIRQRMMNERLLSDLRQRTTEAEQANRDKSRLLAATSHDLRQPLHALDLFLASLKPRLSDLEQLKLLEKARLSSTALGELLNSLLDISRLDAGEVAVQKTEFDLADVLDGCVEEFSPLAQAKGLNLGSQVAPGLFVRGDRVLLARIVRNLISNAVRYTEQGDIAIQAFKRDGMVIVEVKDSGKGIRPEDLPHIFDEFYQIDNPERDRDKGLGLGLAIVRRLADLMGIRIEVDSRLGGGSCFRLLVPALEDAPVVIENKTRANISAEALAGMSVMIVEDDRAILDAMRQLLRDWHCEVFAAEGMDEALSELRQHDYPSPDIIIADYRLRDQRTGIEAIKAIRAHFGRNIPAIMVSGEAGRDAESIAQDQGLLFLRKPVKAEELASILGRVREEGDATAA